MTLPEEQDSLYPFESAPDKALGSRVLGVLRKWVNEKGFRRIMRFCSTVLVLVAGPSSVVSPRDRE